MKTLRNQLINVRIYEINTNHPLIYITKGDLVIDSLLIADPSIDRRRIFEDLFETVKYDYCDYPREFIMEIDCLDNLDKYNKDNSIKNSIVGFTEEYRVNDYDDIESLIKLTVHVKGDINNESFRY